MKDQRPVNLDITTLRMPITAIVSILHRISGLLMFLAIPFILYLLQASLTDNGFRCVHGFVSGGVVKFILWAVMSAAAYHIIAGVRHLFMDLGFGEGKSSARATSYLVLLLSIVIIVLMGVWLWA